MKRQSARSFREVAEEWWQAKGKFGKNAAIKSSRTQTRDKKLLENLYRAIGERAISEIDAAESCTTDSPNSLTAALVIQSLAAAL